MRYVAAYLLAALGGNEKPSADDIKKILSSVGVSAEDDKIKIVIDQLAGKAIEEVIAEGVEKLASVPSGGAVAAGGAPAAAGGAPAAAEEKKAEPEEESEDEDMDGFSLFD